MQHLLGPDNFLSLNDFRCKYEIDPRPLRFYGLISAVKALRIDSNFSRFAEHQPRKGATYNKNSRSQKLH